MAKQLYNQPSPLETRVVSKNFAMEGSETLDVYLANDGYKAFRKAKEMTPGGDHRGSEDLGAARAWRGWLSHRT